MSEVESRCQEGAAGDFEAWLEWFIAGYSFPETDGHINGLLRDSYRDNRRGRDIAEQMFHVLGHGGPVHAPRMGFAKFLERMHALQQ